MSIDFLPRLSCIILETRLKVKNLSFSLSSFVTVFICGRSCFQVFRPTPWVWEDSGLGE